MTKQEQIEEMAKRIHIATDLYYIECIKVATYLFEKDNCRIVDKDSVVLTREEAERFRGQTINIAKVKVQARKETAKEIYDLCCGHGTTFIKKYLKEKYGVGVEE